MIPKIKIGDGTAPAGFPAYSAASRDVNDHRVRCNFMQCGHLFDNGDPCKPLSCGGGNCSCPCCRMLAGEVVHGCTLVNV
jgi:hypothetical protein